LPNPEAKRKIIFLILTERNELDRVREAGSAIRPQKLGVLVVRHLRKLGTRGRRVRRLSPRRATWDKKEQGRKQEFITSVHGVLGSFGKIRVNGRPLRLLHSATQFVLTEFRGDAVSLCLDANGDRNIRGHPPDVWQRRKQGCRSVFERRRIGTERPGSCEHHRLGDAASAGCDNGEPHGGEDVDVVALRNRNLASLEANGGEWRTGGPQSASVGPEQ